MTPDTLNEIYTRTIRSGNTTAVVEFAKQHGAIVIVHDQREEARVRALGVQALSVERGPMAFVGSNRGYIVDIPVIARAAQEWSSAIVMRRQAERERDEQRARADAAEARARTAEARVVELRSQIRDLREAAAATEATED
jgi:hypothetical protein